LRSASSRRSAASGPAASTSTKQTLATSGLRASAESIAARPARKPSAQSSSTSNSRSISCQSCSIERE
jgi:hypothetical protein